MLKAAGVDLYLDPQNIDTTNPITGGVSDRLKQKVTLRRADRCRWGLRGGKR
jgi:hypothetical protein